MTIKRDDYSNGHGYWRGRYTAMGGVRVTMQGVVRHGRNVILPVLLLGTHAAGGRLITPNVVIGFVAILYSRYLC